MHLSHIIEDLEAWYLNFDFDERVTHDLPAAAAGAAGTQTVPQRSDDVATANEVRRDYDRFGRDRAQRVAPAGLARLQHDVVGPDGTVYRKGTAIPQRADFNTLDNPFFWSATRARPDGRGAGRRASTSSSSTRRATTSTATGSRWTACCPDGDEAASSPRAPRPGLQLRSSTTTHRQNFLVPPRRHRSFPLVELDLSEHRGGPSLRLGPC